MVRFRSARRALAAVVLGTATLIAVATAPGASASGPASLGVSGWQVYGSTAIYANPVSSTQIHGYPGQYAAAPAVPAQDDAGWADCGPTSPLRSSPHTSTRPLCPNATTIGMNVGSILSGCWNNLNFTYFQALVSIPEGTDVTQFSVNMSGADDGARVSLVNSAHQDGVTPSAGYIYQGTPQATGDLSVFVVAGEVNRVVITQVDDCAVGNNLGSAQVFLNGSVVPPAPVDADGDGVPDTSDNCPTTANADQADNDGDGDGDACDTDDDGDGTPDDDDAFPYDPTEDTDTDGDGTGDNGDTCPNDADNDADGDGTCGDVDTLPHDPNVTTETADAGGICSVVQRLATKNGARVSLCNHLMRAQGAADSGDVRKFTQAMSVFDKELTAQTNGKNAAFTAANAATIRAMAALWTP